MAVRDRIRGAGFHAVTAENATRIVNIVNGSVAFSGGNPIHIRVFCRFDVNAICRARRCAQKASNALFQAVLIPMEHVNSSVPRLEVDWLVRIIFRHRLLKHCAESDTEAFYQRARRLHYFPDDGCHELGV